MKRPINGHKGIYIEQMRRTGSISLPVGVVLRYVDDEATTMEFLFAVAAFAASQNWAAYHVSLRVASGGDGRGYEYIIEVNQLVVPKPHTVGEDDFFRFMGGYYDEDLERELELREFVRQWVLEDPAHLVEISPREVYHPPPNRVSLVDWEE